MIDSLIMGAIVTCTSAVILLLLFIIVVGYGAFCAHEKYKEIVNSAAETFIGALNWAIS